MSSSTVEGGANGSISATPRHRRGNYVALEVGLRLLLFAASVTCLVLMLTANQTQDVALPGQPQKVPRSANFYHSPAFVYLVVAITVACLYSILTTLACLSVISKPTCGKLLLLSLAYTDMLLMGVVAAATGAAGAVAYIGLKGNSHAMWGKMCPLYGNYCRHVGSSIAISLFATLLLLLLSMLSIFSIYHRIRD